MNQLDLPEMIELLKREENANLKRELAELIVSTIINDISLRDEIAGMVSREIAREVRRSGI
jgi:hypothetical protein